MPKKPSTTPSFNPSRFEDALVHLYPSLWKAEGRAIKTECEKLARLLARDESREAQTLAAKLSECKPTSRCRSGACPQCGHAAQKLFTAISRAFVRARVTDGQETVCISIVPADGIREPGRLDAGDTQRAIRRWKERLGRAGIGWFVGGLDYSFNEHDDERYQPHWSEHIFGFTATTDKSLLKKALRKQFPKTDSIPRPVRVEVWDGGTDALDYMLKPEAWRRVGTNEGQRTNADSDVQRSCRDTDKQRLKSGQRRELALHLDKIGFSGRQVMRWTQFTNLGDEGSVLAYRPPRGRSRENG